MRSRGGGEGEIGGEIGAEARSSGKIGGKVERRWDRSGEIEQCGASIDERRSAAINERHGATIDDQCGAIVGLELGLWSLAKSLLPLSLRSGLFLSFVRVGFFFLWLSLSFARATENV